MNFKQQSEDEVIAVVRESTKLIDVALAAVAPAICSYKITGHGVNERIQHHDQGAWRYLAK